MKSLKIFFQLFIIVLVISVLVTNCKDKYEYIDYEKLEKQEKELLEKFYKSEIFKNIIADGTDTIFINDTTFNIVIDSLDKKDVNGLIMVRSFRSSNNDSIKIGKTAGFRYTFWYVDEDKDKDTVIVLYPLFTNEYANEPDYYTVGNYTTTSATMSYGIDYGIQNMFLLDKSIMILPSTIGAQSLLGGYSAKDRYKIIIAEIEITYFPDNY